MIWFNARAEVDKLNRAVTLDQVQLTKVNFPAEPAKNDELTQLLNAKLPYVTKTVSLDRLMSATEADGQPIKEVEVKNDPPTIIFSTKTSVLVLIDGPAQMREIEGTKLQRVINTRPFCCLRTTRRRITCAFRIGGCKRRTSEGPWTYAKKLPDDMKKAEEYIVRQDGRADTANRLIAHFFRAISEQATKPQPSLKATGKKGEIPAVYVVFGPAELLETRGEPVFKPIPGTANWSTPKIPTATSSA